MKSRLNDWIVCSYIGSVGLSKEGVNIGRQISHDWELPLVTFSVIGSIPASPKQVNLFVAHAYITAVLTEEQARALLVHYGVEI